MSRYRAIAWVGLPLVLCVALAQQDSRDHESEVGALFAPWAQGNTPGAGVLVVRDGRVALSRGFGLANLDTKTPIGLDTAFLLASMSKQFTAMAIMILAERGRLSYGDPLARFFPEFPSYARSITIQHLLNHTSGLPDYEQLFVKTGKISAKWPRSIQEPPDKYEPSAADALRLLAQQPELRFRPGARWEYSNSGYMVLGQIVEKASGRRYREFLREAVFQPLGMTETAVYDETKPDIPNRAASYGRQDGSFSNIDYTPLNGIYGEDNVVSTLNDLYKWDQALYGERLVKRATLAEAFTPGRLNDNSPTGYGFGWQVGERLGLRYTEHGGSWLGFRTFILRYPDEHFTVAVLSNFSQFDPGTTANKVARIYLRGKMTLPAAKDVSAEILRNYAGSYEFSPQLAAAVTVEEGELWIQLPRREKQKLLAESDTHFFVEGQEYITFDFKRDTGGVVSLTMSGSRTGRKVK